MSKLSKLFHDPKLFLTDALQKKLTIFTALVENGFEGAKRSIPSANETLKDMSVQTISQQFAGSNRSGVSNSNTSSYQKNTLPKTYLFGFSPWKQFMTAWFPDREMIFIDKNITPELFKSDWEKRIINSPAAEIMIWGFKSPKFLQRFVQAHQIPLLYVEDGFIRSVNLGATKTPPFSLSIDRRTPYFNAREASDLEVLLSTYDFASNPALLQRAENMMQLLLDTGISKYNQSIAVDINAVYGRKDRKRILVIGQVEDDASIEYGCEVRYSNNDLVMMARLENPDAQIIYKPHPDVLHGKRPMQSNPDDVRHICQVLDQDIPLAQSFETIDHVYTITSQAGFEALQRGLSVTTLGCPFYSGWGLTDDRQPNARRTRQLSITEVFAGAYLLYMRYFDPIYKVAITGEEAVMQLVKLRELECQLDTSIVVPKRLMWMLGFNSVEHYRYLVAAYPDHELTFLSLEDLNHSNQYLNEIKNSASTADVVLNTTLPMAAYERLLREWGVVPHYFATAPLSRWWPTAHRYDGFIVDQLGNPASAAQLTTLESMLMHYDFIAQQETIHAWYEQCTQYLAIPDAHQHSSEPAKNRIMVFAESFHDSQMRVGNALGYNTLDLLALARHEHPSAELICYSVSADAEFVKALPLTLKRSKNLGKITYIDASKTSLQAALHEIDQVYVVAADAGLMARWFGVKVTTLGTPFYAGWGLTDDRVSTVRRQRSLTLEQLLWVVLHLYSHYMDNIYKRRVSLIEVLAAQVTTSG